MAITDYISKRKGHNVKIFEKEKYFLGSSGFNQFRLHKVSLS